MTLTTSEAGDRLGVGDSGVRKLVQRGKLRPVRPGARPLRFHEADVVELERQRLSADQAAEIGDAWAEVHRRRTERLAAQVSGVSRSGVLSVPGCR